MSQLWLSRTLVTKLCIMEWGRLQQNSKSATSWWVHGRQFVCRLMYNCSVFLKSEEKPHQSLLSPASPWCCVQQSWPFQHAGVDFGSPLFVKNQNNSQVCYVHTCCVTRVVHLAIAPDLNTTSFIWSFKGFTSRQVTPSKMVSDKWNK